VFGEQQHCLQVSCILHGLTSVAVVGHDEHQRRTCSHGADGWKYLLQLDRVEAKRAGIVDKVKRGVQVG